MRQADIDTQHLNDATLVFLKLNQESHTKEQLHFCLSKLEELPFFKSFVEQQLKGTQRNDVLELCSRLRVEYFKGGEVVFQENDPSNDKLYIILYGSVILMRLKKMDVLQSLPHKEVEKASAVSLAQVLNVKKFTNKLLMASKENTISQQERALLVQKYGDVLRTMRRGEGFGERALLENIPRFGTVAACSLELFLVVLKKDDFMQFQTQFERQVKEKQRLMFQVFKNVNNEYSTARLESMIYSCHSVQFERGAYLTVQDEPGEVFYIIQTGDVKLYKKESQLQLPLCIVSTGHLLGEEIVINSRGVYDYTAQVCSPSVKVMVIQASQFFNMFPEECRKQIILEYRSRFLNRSQQFSHLSTSIPKLEKSQLFEPTPSASSKVCRNEVEEERKLFAHQELSKDFLKQTESKSFIIKKYVENEIKICNKYMLGSPGQKSTLMQAFDFGTMTQDQAKRNRYLFEWRLNAGKPPQNFLKPKGNVLPQAVKQVLIKGIKRTRRVICQSQSNLNIRTLSRDHCFTQP